ncbi:unnamed protein product [Gadus morhua 'NCC']
MRSGAEETQTEPRGKKQSPVTTLQSSGVMELTTHSEHQVPVIGGGSMRSAQTEAGGSVRGPFSGPSQGR